MKKLGLISMFLIPLSAVFPQATSPEGFKFWSAASLNQANADLVDVVYVLSGSATLVVGGTLVNGETVAPHEKRNGTIEGGTRQKVSAGDWLRIPPKTPHQFLLEGAKEFTYMVVKAKGY
jgi:hypothetical protein